MIRKILFISLFTFLATKGFAQQDTGSYKAQRVKVNSLLTQRSLKFGQYDESLKQRSGIFGLQTKKDLRNSNDILRTVVLNDNQIFKEIKALMEYKDLQNQQKVAKAGNDAERMTGYMHTIKKLQDEQRQLKDQLSTKKTPISGFLLVILGLIVGGASTFIFLRVKNKKASD
ncbi:hypothetical protein ABIB40_000423 [Pedobacter sp. UYP30]|uniref:hypothetical protein n=1 Tax=Pedobacter sp. UYP30 TaxID=1756400 RepID=UPI003399A118